MKRVWWLYGVAMIVGLYTSFVAMCMWNWFATRALKVPEASYLAMVGVVWLIQLLLHKPDADDFRWKVLATCVDACIPEHKREQISEALKEQQESLWVDIGSKIFGQVVGNTVTLCLGFGLQAFL